MRRYHLAAIMHFLAVLCLSIIAGSNVANATDNPDGLFLRKTVTTSPDADGTTTVTFTNIKNTNTVKNAEAMVENTFDSIRTDASGPQNVRIAQRSLHEALCHSALVPSMTIFAMVWKAACVKLLSMR